MCVYSEMECDMGCKDGCFCSYYDESCDRCCYPNKCSIYKGEKKKYWWQK